MLGSHTYWSIFRIAVKWGWSRVTQLLSDWQLGLRLSGLFPGAEACVVPAGSLHELECSRAMLEQSWSHFMWPLSGLHSRPLGLIPGKEWFGSYYFSEWTPTRSLGDILDGWWDYLLNHGRVGPELSHRVTSESILRNEVRRHSNWGMDRIVSYQFPGWVEIASDHSRAGIKAIFRATSKFTAKTDSGSQVGLSSVGLMPVVGKGIAGSLDR